MIEKVKGFQDLYPEDYFLFSYVTKIIKKTAYSFGFQQYDSAILESTDLYKKKSGNEIMSQLFEFEDKSKRKVTLRPEMTPSLIRLVSKIVKSYPKPIKWFSINENFRYEKPQKGRLRSFYQFNFDILCEESIISDLEIITLLINCFKALGLNNEDFCIKISDRILWNYILESLLIEKNDIDKILFYIDKSSKDNDESLLFFLKNNYKNNDNLIFNFIKKFMLCDNIDKIINFINNEKNIIQKEKINIRINNLKNFFNLLNLSNLNKYYILDFKIVRGISYYTGIVFEVFHVNNKGRSICGGGRYNTFSLFDINYDIPAIGFAIGYTPLLDLLKNKKNLLPIYENNSEIFFIINYKNENDIKEAFYLINEIRYIYGYKVEYVLDEININKQIKKAYISRSKIIILYEQNIIKIKNINDNNRWKIIQKNEIYNYINLQK